LEDLKEGSSHVLAVNDSDTRRRIHIRSSQSSIRL